MPPEPLRFVTTNAGKAREVQEALHWPVSQVSLELQELQSLDLEQIVLHKLEQARQAIATPVLVEDTALRFLGWGGLPGPFVKYFLERLGVQGMVAALAPAGDWRAEAITGLGLWDAAGAHYFEGRVAGTIVAPAGSLGFGWDPIFRPEGALRTFGEMPLREKLDCSMRGQALRKLAAYLHGGPPAENA